MKGMVSRMLRRDGRGESFLGGWTEAVQLARVFFSEKSERHFGVF